MSIKYKLKNKLFKSAGGRILFFQVRRVREEANRRLYSDYRCLNRLYRQRFGRNLNLAEPIAYTEKLQWLKLFYRHPDMPRCSDKYEVHNYLKGQGHSELSNELLGVYDDSRKIDFAALPNKFVAKANHGSSWNLICKDKSKFNWKDEAKVMNMWLKLDLSVFGREWNYHEIKPRIVIEKFIEHEPLNDYKFMCFNGEPLYMQLNNDFEGKHYVDFYELSTWKRLPFTYGVYRRSNRDVEKPPMFDRMMELARELSKPFPFVRVDFYNYDDVILLGELTFFPGGGLLPLNPVETGYDEILGKCLTLPEPNYNLELYKKICKKK